MTATKETLIKSFVDATKLKTDVAINPANLDDAMIEHSALYVHYAVNTVNARRQYERLKASVDIIYAQIEARVRDAFIAEGKKATEAMISSAVKTDKKMISANSQLIEAQTAWKLAEVAEKSFDMRKDMILELARDRRKEREGQLRVTQQQEERSIVMDMLNKRANGG